MIYIEERFVWAQFCRSCSNDWSCCFGSLCQGSHCDKGCLGEQNCSPVAHNAKETSVPPGFREDPQGFKDNSSNLTKLHWNSISPSVQCRDIGGSLRSKLNLDNVSTIHSFSLMARGCETWEPGASIYREPWHCLRTWRKETYVGRGHRAQSTIKPLPCQHTNSFST